MNSNIDNLPYSPDEAIKQKRLSYKAKIEDEKTGEIYFVERPIFAIEKKKGEGLFIHPAYLAAFFQLSEKVVYLRNSALGTVIRYIYEDGVYRQKSDNDLSKILLKYIGDYKFNLKKLYPVEEARQIIDKEATTIEHDQMNTEEKYINFRNGLLDITTMKMCPHSPEFFSTIQIPCDWTDEPQETPIFDKFTFTEGNKDKQRLLLEYIGAVISNIYGYRFKKCLFLVGEGDSGKSLISKLIVALIGNENKSERSLKRLSERFGETAVYMKRFVYSGDLSFMKIDQMDRFKELTGGDTISIEFKNSEPFDYQFRGLMLFGMNALPKFGGDKGTHVYERMIIVKCDNVIQKNQQDPYLLEKLQKEQLGIIQKAIYALHGVIKNHYQFHIPDECKVNIEEYKTTNSAVIEFWKECIEKCKENEECMNLAMQIYKTYNFWSKQNGHHYTASFPEFRNEISQYLNLSWLIHIVYRKKSGSYLKNYKLNDTGIEIYRSIE